MKKPAIGIGAAFALGLLLQGLPADANAQSPPAVRAERLVAGERGWIGISFNVLTDPRGRIQEIMIADVSPGSPAQRAGIRPGDQILAINELDEPHELAELSARLHLLPGDNVVIAFMRDGQRSESRMEAAGRPDALLARNTLRLSSEADSMVETWVRAMDSLRIQLVSERGRDVRIRRVLSGEGREVTVIADGSGEAMVRTRAVRAPFEFFVFRGESHDSLRLEMSEVNRVADELEALLTQRERQLRRRSGSSTRLDLSQDYEFKQLSDALQQVADRSSELEDAMAQAARQTAGLDYVRETQARQAPTATREVSGADEFRPLTPYLLGRNRVAGAEVIDLKTELAQYFGVGRGILVVDVASGTPASMAGIVPGDVITRIDQVSVQSVEDLRFGVSMAGDTLPISLVREGGTIQLLLRR
ncbi:MAG: PDZ domain-containing protein [Longimicrobiales bacterium]|nr:PDZ domain-containing protein [Longimicrobiales bacterium]